MNRRNILDLASDIKVVIKSGSWYSYNGSKIGQGREAAKEYCKLNPKIMMEIERKVREHYKLQTDVIMTDSLLEKPKVK